MKTPAGTECPFFYGDYYRGRTNEECRLIGNVAGSGRWTRDLCAVCPVPRITRANACEFMALTAKVNRGVLGIGKKVIISAYCSKSKSAVKVPEVGCGICHPIDSILSDPR